MINPADTILRQYAADPVTAAVIGTFNQSLGLDDFIDEFYDQVWNIQTAETYGLDVWGKIVGIGRNLTVTPSEVYFGFDEASSQTPVVNDPEPFNQAPFYTRGTSATSTVTLSDDAFRKLIIVKAAANISDCTIPNLNRLLQMMFGERGRAYVSNDSNMQMSYVFEFALTPSDLAIIQDSGAFPAPAGVLINIVQQVTQ